MPGDLNKEKNVFTKMTLCGLREYKMVKMVLSAADEQREIDLIIDKASKAYDAGPCFEGVGKAIKILSKGLRTHKNNGCLLNRRGWFYLVDGKKKLADNDFSTVIKTTPLCARDFIDRARAYLSLGDHENAIANAEEAVRRAPQDAACYNGRGDIFYSFGEYENAIADYSCAVRLESDNMIWYCDRANAYEHNNDINSAIADYTKVIEINPEYEEAYYRRGMLYLMNDTAAAIKDFSRLIEINPKNNNYREMLKEITCL